MSDTARFHVTPVSTFQLSQTLALVLNRENEDILELEPIAAGVLGRCYGARPLEAHATIARQAGVASNPHAIANAMDTLISLGLLRQMADPVPAVPAGTQNIDTIAIVTADRPQSLARGLEAIARHRTVSQPRVLVIDGSRVHGAHTRTVVERAAADYGLDTRYVGAAEAAQLRERLAEASIPRPVLDAALTPGSIGSNRNLATLLTAGRLIVMQDDDVVCEPWALPDREDGVVMGGHVDLRAWRFFTSRQEAMSSVTPVDADLWAAHAAVLGQPLANILSRASTALDVEHACNHMVAALTESEQRHVRVTFAGLAGDAARYCSHGVLFLQGAVREALWRDPTLMETAITSREIASIARRTVLTHDPACMAYCMGVDNTALVPPFMPTGRNEDGVWGTMLGFADPQALFAHLPYGIRHDSNRPAVYDDPMPSVRQCRISEFLLFVVHRLARSTFAASPDERLRHLGQICTQIGQLPRDEFRLLLMDTRLNALCGELSRQEALAAANPECPLHWRAAFEEYSRIFRKHVTQPDFFLPIEFKDATSIDEGFARAQTFVQQFGELLTWWPQMWAAAARHNQEHDGLTERN